MCGDSILKEMKRTRKVVSFMPEELDRYMHWKPGATPTPNLCHPLQTYAAERGTVHRGQMIALPVRESCPGGPSADEGGDTERVPQGVPEVGCGWSCGCGQCLKWVWPGLNCAL